jgi:hypothetical protein
MAPFDNSDTTLITNPTVQPTPGPQPAPVPASAQPQPAQALVTPQAPTAAQAPASGTPATQQQPTNGQPQTQQAQQVVSNPGPATQPQTAQSQTVKANPHAGRVYATALALAGGQRFTERFDDQGNKILTPVMLSRKDIGMAIALEAISGALSGLQAGRGHGLGAATAAGFQQGSQMRQREIDQQDDQANKDLARRAAVAEANMRMLNSAVQVGRLAREDHEQMVSSYSDQLQDWKDNAGDLIKAEHVPESEAKDVQKYNMADYLRIPDGTVPRIDESGRQVYTDSLGRIVPQGTPGAIAQWDNTYSLIDKKAKARLTESDGQPMPWVRKAVAYGLPGWPESLLRAASGTEIPAATALRAQHQTVMLDALQSELNSFTKSFGTNKDGSPKMAPIDLKAAIQRDPTVLKAVQQFQRAAGMSTQPDRQIDAMRQDPKTAPFAGKIMALFGPDNLEQYKSNRESREAAAKSGAEAQARLQVENSPEAIQAAVDKENRLRPGKVETAREETTARKQAEQQVDEQADAANIQKYGQETPVNGVRQNYLASLPVATSALVKEIGEGRQFLSPYAIARSKDGKQLASQVAVAYPGYDFSRAQSYEKTRQTFTSGKVADGINALNTAMQHMQVMYDNASWLASLPGLGAAARAAGSQQAIDLENAKSALVDELGRAYKNAALTIEDKKTWESRINSWSPKEIKGNAVSFVKLLDGKLTSYQQQWKAGSPPAALPPFPIMSDEAQEAYKHITGASPRAASAQSEGSAAPQNVAPEGTVISVNGQQLVKQNGQWVPQGR